LGSVVLPVMRAGSVQYETADRSVADRAAVTSDHH
jgi:hypothetical protein